MATVTEESMEASIAERKVLRSYITSVHNKACSGVEDAINMSRLKLKFERMQVLDKVIESFITTEEDMYQEKLTQEAYRDKYLDLIESENSNTTTNNNTNSGPLNNIQLPKLQYLTFDGDLCNWAPFWAQFENINNNNNLSDDIKFQYLLQFLTGKAKEFIANYPPSGKNYKKAVADLKNRFARDDILTEYYIRQLLDTMITQLKFTKLSLSELYNKIRSQINNLESLNLNVENYDLFLVPLIESCLPVETLKLWDRNKMSSTQDDIKHVQLNKLLEFIQAEVDMEEKIKLSRNMGNCEQSQIFTASALQVNSYKKNLRKQTFGKQNTNGNNSGNKVLLCIFCTKSHLSQECIKAQKMSLDEKIKLIRDKNACSHCLKTNHSEKFCRTPVRCVMCSKKHYPVMCSLINNKSDQNNTDNEPRAEQTVTTLCKATRKVLLQTLQVYIINGTRKQKIRLLIDSGSQHSYLLSSTANNLQLKSNQNIEMIHKLFGGIETRQVNHRNFEICLQSLDGSYTNIFKVLDQNEICSPIPRIQAQNSIPKLSQLGIEVSDVGEGTPQIELLIGADNIAKILTNENVKIDESLAATKTLLGWCVIGTCSNLINTHVESTISTFCMNISDLWTLDILGIKDRVEVKSKQDADIEMYKTFESTIYKDDTDRYIVKLPWKHENVKPDYNKNQATQRLVSLHKKLSFENKYDSYIKEINLWEAMDIIEKVSEEEADKDIGFYLPHRPIFKPQNCTTVIRPVFDGGAKLKDKLSINECLNKGPNTIEDIPVLLNKFRLKKYAVVSDIKKAFLMIGIHPDDRKYLKFLIWDEKQKTIIEYQHKRLVFGLVCSPFVLGATLAYHIKNRADTKLYLELKNSFYVDNLLYSTDTLEKMQEFVLNTQKLLFEGKFELREWTFNKYCSPIIQEIQNLITKENIPFTMANKNKVNVLGLKWDTMTDELYCNFTNIKLHKDEKVTKRNILSWMNQIFDPIGIYLPITLTPKLLLQELWMLKVSWDETLDEKYTQKMKEWLVDIENLSECKIDRWLNYKPEDSHSIHVFCDASAVAYGCAIFLRIQDKNIIKTQLISAKSRITTIKKISIPRLELLGCSIGVRLYLSIKESLPEMEVHFWTDSTVSLCWLQNTRKTDVYVKNRVTEILKYTKIEQWHHVPGSKNPADILTRPVNSQTVINSKWWQGPRWMNDDKEYKDMNVNLQQETHILTTTETEEVLQEDCMLNLITYFSSYKRIIKATAYILRFLHKTREPKIKISSEEYNNAEKWLLKYIQNLQFSSDIPKFSNMKIFRDQDGLLKVKTKLLLGDFEDNFKTPILLAHNHTLINKIVRSYHIEHNHASAQTIRIILRQNYFILQCKKLTRQIVRECITCQKQSSKSIEVVPAPLPRERVNLTTAFDVVGVDCAGPLYLKNNEKCWIVIFTCGVYRAVHFELVLSMSTESFILALRRFFARRGRSRVIFSDNGTNFVGCSNLLKTVDWNKIEDDGIEPIRWKHIPPSSPWWGGFYERMVGLLKNLLRRVLGKALLSYEELYTVLCSCEATVNERPLTYVFSNSEEPEALTPSMFIRDVRSMASVPDLDDIDEKSLINRHKYLQNLRSSLKQRFQREYLSTLVEFRRTKLRHLKVNDIVLVESDNTKRANWPLGRVLSLLPGTDGHARLAKIQINKNVLVRPFQRLHLLEGCALDSDFETPSVQEVPTTKAASAPVHEKEASVPVPESLPKPTTRCGRTIKKPIKLNI